MARTLYLNDGSTEIVIGDQEEVLGRIIEERLGRDCKELFDDIKEEWIESNLVQEYFNLTFGECFRRFEFCRTAEWNKYPLEGQKITTYFRKGVKSNG